MSGLSITSNSDLLSELSLNQIKVLECLISYESDSENYNWSLEDIAEDAGVSTRTVSRYLQDPKFKKAYISRIDDLLIGSRYKITKNLVNSAMSPGNSPAMRLYYELQGLLKKQLEVEVTNNSPVQLNNLPLAVKKLLIYLVNGGVLDKQIEDVISRFCEDKVLNENMKVIETKVIEEEQEEEIYSICQI